MEGRGIDVDEQARAGIGRLVGGELGPQVFANREGDAGTEQVHHAGGIAGAEIALLVEDLVIGQALLAVGGDALAPVNHRQRVV